jgi:hypothetical protein
MASGSAPAAGILAGRGSFRRHVRTITCPRSSTAHVYNVEIQLTQKVRAEFIGRGKYRSSPKTKGRRSSSARSWRWTGAAAFDDQRIATRANAHHDGTRQLRSLSENKVLWESQNLIFRDDYDVQTSTARSTRVVLRSGCERARPDHSRATSSPPFWKRSDVAPFRPPRS